MWGLIAKLKALTGNAAVIKGINTAILNNTQDMLDIREAVRPSLLIPKIII